LAFEKGVRKLGFFSPILAKSSGKCFWIHAKMYMEEVSDVDYIGK